jgi:hypothetical protein
MPPIFIPPLVKIAIVALGAGAAIRWLTKEVRRINDELERVKTASAIDPTTRKELPTLRRDPSSGDWRVS